MLITDWAAMRKFQFSFTIINPNLETSGCKLQQMKVALFKEVTAILVSDGAVQGVRLANGKEVHARTVLSNTTPKVTFEDLIAEV